MDRTNPDSIDREASNDGIPPSAVNNEQYGADFVLDDNDYSGAKALPTANDLVDDGDVDDLLDDSSIIHLRDLGPYPSWIEHVPITKEEIFSVFLNLKRKFGFQTSSMENMFDHLLTQLDSRASRLTPTSALTSLHASYIGGDSANYKKWFFAAQFDLDEELGFSHMKLHGQAYKRNKKIAKSKNINLQDQRKRLQAMEEDFAKNHMKLNFTPDQLERNFNSTIADYKWKMKMHESTTKEKVEQIALYLLIWGEANQVRYLPECLCFIYKCAYDYYVSDACKLRQDPMPDYHFLNTVITPIYKFLRDQMYYVKADGKMVRKEKDHAKVIGYDDVNQLFWYPEGIERISLKSTKERLVDIKLEERYSKFADIDWNKAFHKTYRETRTWLHVATNFNRIWIIHLSSFWFFTSFNSPTLYTKNYDQLLDNQPTLQSRFSAVALGGTVACIIQIIATLAEWSFVPREWPGAQHLTRRLVGLMLILLLNFLPSVFVFGFHDLETHSEVAYVTSIIQFVISIITVIFFSFMPLGDLFGRYLKNSKSRRYVSSRTFTAAFPQLSGRNRWFSIFLWSTIFTAKFIESYFFLTLSIRDPIRVLSIMDMTRCIGDSTLGTVFCRHQAKFTLSLIYFTDLILFFLDTYLWYIVCNCIFSVGLSFSLGISILTPWRNVFSRLPKRIYSKVLATNELDIKYKPKILVSQVWNAIIISMYREHLLPMDLVHKLLYHQVDAADGAKRTLSSPSFFIAHDDSTYKSSEFFPPHSEAQRRISFFAQSLSTPIPEPISVECMPIFTVLIPHYGEKIILSLKEIIRENNINARITLLEYLKELYPTEWDCFVRDTKLLAIENGALSETSSKFDTTRKRSVSDYGSKIPVEGETVTSDEALEENELIPNSPEDNVRQGKINDIPFYCVGFKTSSPEYILRTRIWASLRTQTLYRTASGFTNYARALKLLYRIENPNIVQYYYNDPESLDRDLEAMAHRKFKLLIAMQRMMSFTDAEKDDTEFLLRAYPDTRISYLEQEDDPLNPTGEKIYFSCMVDGFSTKDENGRRPPKYRIRLSGNPILGDGKSDNQNHSLIFYRGEYIQVVDANQDNYLEECIKIRSVLAEFEELDQDNTPPYIPGIIYKDEAAPVAIVGAREYIFSGNIGVLGDVAAGKEQTFGTLFARTLAEIGGKLHYGHPDFLNAIFMTTRGGISKAQKGLHLNEDIYAGMNAMIRGGRIKHCDYYQCGKGRDLGFASILNFTTKIGAGMGEQILSREYYYLGTQLPLDRFLSFYYAHPGFHINNLFITLSLQMFMIVLVNLGALVHESTVCDYNKDIPFTDLQKPIGCYNLQPILNWVTIFVFSVFIVFFISFVPLIVQELTERGLWRAFSRFFHHILSLSPFFEVFVCQIYSMALITDVTFSGAKYISTGRGFAVTRTQFFYLYSKFASSSIYSGGMLFLMLLFSTLTIWQPALLWFWITLVSMCTAPFMFNPHQFSFNDYFVDYRDFIHWLSRGNSKWHANSWIMYAKQSRAKYTGYKKVVIGHESENGHLEMRKSHLRDTFFTEMFLPLATSFLLFLAYEFINSQNGVKDVKPTNSTLRLVILVFAPILSNMITLLLIFCFSCIMGPALSCCCCTKKVGGVLAGFAHFFSVVSYLLTFEVLWFLEGWNFPRALSCLLCVISVQNFLFKFITILLFSREFKHDKINRSWWSGNWYKKAVGWGFLSQPLREYLVKVIEMSLFAGDFILGHCILFVQTPFVFIPFIDRWHSMILFWLKPNRQFKARILSKRQLKKRRIIVFKYIILYFAVLILFLSLLIVPIFTHKFLPDVSKTLDNTVLQGLIQPNGQDYDDTGTKAPSTIITTTGTRPEFKTVFW